MGDAPAILPALFAFTAAVFLIALSKAYAYSLGALLVVLANALNVNIPVVGHVFGFLSNAVKTLDDDIRFAIGKGIDALEYDAAFWFSWFAQVQQAIADNIADVAESTFHALERHAKVLVPLSITALLAPLRAIVHRLEAQVNAHVKTLPATVTKITNLTKSYPVRVERVAGLPRIVKAAVAAALAGTAGALTLPRFGQLEREIAALRARLSRTGTALGVGSIVGVVAFALSRLGLGSQQCSNNKRYSKHICGMERNLLDSLLADTLLLVGTFSLVEFAREMVTVQEAVTEPIRLFWRVR